MRPIISFLSFSSAGLMLLNHCPSASAQANTNIRPDVPPEPIEPALPTPEQPLPGPEALPEQTDPILPTDEPASSPQTEIESPDRGNTPFYLREIQVRGNTILEEEIEALVNDFLNSDVPNPDVPNPNLDETELNETNEESDLEGAVESTEVKDVTVESTQPVGRETTLAELLDLRTDITALYVEAGFITSGAFVPTGQELTDGRVQIQVVEGSVEEIQINGLRHLKPYYVRDRIQLATNSPLNIHRLEEGLQLLQNDPILKRVDAELTAGRGAGSNVLVLDLQENNNLFLDVSLSNTRAPSTGSIQFSPTMVNQNVSGIGDRFTAGYSNTEGLDLYSFSYSVPVNAREGTLSARFEQGESRIVTPRFQDAGIRSETQTISFNYRQPLTRSIAHEVALGIGFDVRESRSFILENEPFSFSLGPESGVSKVSALRLSQDWLNRDEDTVLAARSQFSLGLPAFNATDNDTGTDGQFFAWSGQFQWVQQFAPGTQLLTRLSTQLTGDSLLPLERFSLGGVSTVRGYAQNEIVTDNAIAASVEARFPLTSRPNELQIAPFVDFGTGWNNRSPNPSTTTLLGVGVGLQWRPIENLNMRVDYGIPLTPTRDTSNSLQENGFYFSINSQPF